jgi:uncharacterized protein
MLAVLSPAKKLDFDPAAARLAGTRPRLMAQTNELVEIARQLSAKDLQRLMKLSPALAELNHQRFQDFAPRSGGRRTKPAALAFNGDTYVGLQATGFSPDDMAFAQEHLGILSGLYGVLRPLDLIQPYRLEMGTSLKTERGTTLYAYWGSRIAKLLDKQASRHQCPLIVNLASKEYFSAVQPHLKTPVLHCTFKEVKGGSARVIGFSAKRARGMMARHIIAKRLETPERIKEFKEAGYRYNAKASSGSEWIFLRKH